MGINIAWHEKSWDAKGIDDTSPPIVIDMLDKFYVPMSMIT